MNWFVVRHPDTGGVGVVAESALPIHKAEGWLRVSEPVDGMDRHHVVLVDYAEAPDLDAEPEPAPNPEPTDTKAAAKTRSKEN